MVILAHFSLWISRKLKLLAGTYLGILPDWYKDLDGDPGALLSVDFQEVKAACWDLYLGMLPDWYKEPDGDIGTLLSVDVQEVRATCWDLPWDAP